MDQTTEEALRQELTYMRQKLQDQESNPPGNDLLEERLQDLQNENNRLSMMLEGKLMNFQPGDVLFVHRQDLITSDPNTWMGLAQKFHISIVSLPNDGLNALSKADDKQLRAAGLQAIKEPLVTLDTLMNHFQSLSDVGKNLNQMPYVALAKQAMKHVYDAMQVVREIGVYEAEQLKEAEKPKLLTESDDDVGA